MPRIPELKEEELDAEQRRVFDAIVAGRRGSVGGPLLVWLRSPQLADHAQALGLYCRYGTSLPARLSELAILVIAQHWNAQFEWDIHVPHALKAGLPQGVIDGLRVGAPVFAEADEEAVYCFASELLNTRNVSDETFRRSNDVLGVRGLVDLTGLLGYYTLISMTIKAFDLAPPPAPGV